MATLGFKTIQWLLDETNAVLGYANPDRAYLEQLKNALDRANNNYNFVQHNPCPFTSPY